jgi:flavin reductase (DIM6/NTAB) family NADH-FMN oxidoreductase RutF
LPLDIRRFRDALGQFPTGVVIVTAMSKIGERLGMTVSSFNSVSLDPPLLLFSVHRQAISFATWQQVPRYAVSVLNEEQGELSNRFARAKGEKWTGLSPLAGKTGVPLLPNAAVVFECEAYARHDGGDHQIFVGRVLELHENLMARGRPLVFFDGRYRQLASAATAHTPPVEAAFLHGW